MFSSKVILAVEVLLYLEQHRPDMSRQQGRDPKMLLGAGSCFRPTLLVVLRRLTEARYIIPAWQKKGYLRLVEPAEINLLQLVQLFHGDVCLGELYDHTLTIGRERIDSDSFRRLMSLDEKIRARLRRQLKSISLAELVMSMLPPVQRVPDEKIQNETVLYE